MMVIDVDFAVYSVGLASSEKIEVDKGSIVTIWQQMLVAPSLKEWSLLKKPFKP
jgi:hypothetical protein